MTDFNTLLESALAQRSGIDTTRTTAYRLVNGDGDDLPGIAVERYGEVLLIQSGTAAHPQLVQALVSMFPKTSIYHKNTTRHVRCLDKEAASPTLLHGAAVPGLFPILENGMTFLVRMDAGYSAGLFLDQRDNRKTIRDMSLAGKTVLNTFAYTCAFSVCSALAGATVTSLDLSKKYLDWGRENFRANHLDDTTHDFIYGDIFDWLPRLIKKGRCWDNIILDPPTFSTSKTGRVFKVEKNYPQLIALARSCLAPGGKILACINAHDISIDAFHQLTGIPNILPLPPDFPVEPGSEPHLKAGWTA